MAATVLSKDDAKYAVYGGCILGGGGGGWISEGLEKSEAAFHFGTPTLITIDELQDEDYVACVSLVGAPSAKDAYINETQLIKAVEQLQNRCEKPIKALITNENGAATTINGWLQAAAIGIPILDAPCNGRAHPTGSMGSLNLSEVIDYQSIQAFAGGKDSLAIEGVVEGNLDITSSSVRSLSIHAGGMIAVCRNPVSVNYVKEHAAIGGIKQAIELGQAYFAVPEGPERIETVTSFLKGRVIHSGVVSDYHLTKSNGFDVGRVLVDGLELTFWNEYMTAEIHGERKGTFPDLIMTFDVTTGRPLVSAELQKGMHVSVISVPKENLKLSSTMFNEKLLRTIEPIINKSL